MQPALPGRVKSGIRRFFTRRDFKDRLFVKLFHDKTALLELYNALNGTEERPEQETLRLSDAFEGKDACLECTALMLNINKGHNQELMEKCRELGADREGTVKQLMDKYSLSREAAEETAGRYW